MKAVHEGEYWSVKSDSGHTYKVTLSSCTCPQFMIRLKGRGVCKHMVYINELERKDNNDEEIIDFVRHKEKVRFDDLQKEFGITVFDKLQNLEKKGEIIYNRRNDTYSILE